jgi:hypothetical protein
MERAAVLGAVTVVDVAGLDHVPLELEDGLDSVADERLVAALAGFDRGIRRPHQRTDCADVAAGAVGGQVVALDVAAQRGDLVGVRAEFGEARGRLVRVEAGPGEQVLVVEQRRHVGVQGDAVELLLERRHRHVALAGGLQLGPVLDATGDVDELLRLFELRRVDEVHAHQVGHIAGCDALGDLADHLRVRDVRELDLAVRVLGVPCLDEHVHHCLVTTRTLPHRELAFAGTAGGRWCRVLVG